MDRYEGKRNDVEIIAATLFSKAIKEKSILQLDESSYLSKRLTYPISLDSLKQSKLVFS